MVGIVIVSHSRQLARGVRELVDQMVQGKIPLAVAAGVEDLDNPLGTDAMQVHEAIASVYNDDGVLVLMDLGSALMSAEMALEFLPEEQRENIKLCEAPLVEGAIAAAVAAASGSSIEQVIAEAREALAAKAAQLRIVISPSSFVSGEGQETWDKGQGVTEIRLTISNQLGLHARPAAKFVATAARFQSQIRVRNLTRGTNDVRADSINQVAMLGVRQGHEIAIAAQGDDADEAIAALQALVVANFGENFTTSESCPPSPHRPILSSSPHSLQGIPAAPGVAIAPIFQHCPTHIKVEELCVEDADAEWQRLQIALQSVQEEIQALRRQPTIQIGGSEAAIFDAHLLFLVDPVLIEPVRQRIFELHQNAEFAWQTTVDELAASYHTLEDAYQQERANDVIAVGQQVLRFLVGSTSHVLNMERPSILVATDLTPADTAKLDPKKVLGICTTRGSATSHTAILARALGIPAVVGIKPEVLHLTEGTLLAMDGENGKVWIQPDSGILASLGAKQDARNAAQQQAQATAQAPAIARDGKQVPVLANIGCVADAQVAIERGAEGIGLLRTEFLYLDRNTAPSEDEQLEVYQAIAQTLDRRPLIIRTLDAGGDKSLAYLNLQPEANPFLGWRGIRFCLEEASILKTQLRAILRASLGHQIKVMFPMIATIEEVRAAKAVMAEVQNELFQASIPFDTALELGIMIEVPAAVAIADQLAAEVSFFSIGTNDLSQYAMAADRTNPKVATLADALYPAVLRMIDQTIQAGHTAGIWVGLCGELAANPLAVPILLGLGLDELSINSQSIPRIKQTITQLTIVEAQAIAATALKLDSASQVRALISSFLREFRGD